mgnify:CR=1 FL=1
MRGAGNFCNSQLITILSHPRPNSSQTLRRRISAANFSLRDLGGLSMILMISTNGTPGLVISILLLNNSIIGPDPVI